MKQVWSNKTGITPPRPMGWIAPSERSAEQQKAHEDIMNAAPKFAIARPSLPKGTKIILNDFLLKPEVLTDLGGEVFTGFHQLTGSCVGVSLGDNVAVLSAVQRMVADNPTKAMIPWWAFNYGRGRFLSGFRTQGEGSITSIQGAQIAKEGCFSITEEGFNLPVQFDKSDGWVIPANMEMKWSDGDESLVTQYLNLAKKYPVGTVAPLEDIDAVATSIINGYPVEDGCNYYVGSAKIYDGSGTPYVRGTFNGRGGHATAFTAYWEHPNNGPMYGYWNQWPGSTYPKDPAGLHRCMCWLIEAEAKRLFQLGGNNGETMSLSHLNYHPAQPRVLDWALI